jgi:cytochrome c-type biogenesis protein CcmH/NrfF
MFTYPWWVYPILVILLIGLVAVFLYLRKKQQQ